jgi:hypothetical protein
MSTRQMRSTDKAILQIILKLSYDLRMAEARHDVAWLALHGSNVTPSEDDLRRTTYWNRAGCRDALRQVATVTLQVCAAMPPARRREAWAAFRQSWRTAGDVMKRGGVR